MTIDKQNRINIPKELFEESSLSNSISSGILVRIMASPEGIELFPSTLENSEKEFCAIVKLDNKQRFTIPKNISKMFGLISGTDVLISVKPGGNIFIRWKDSQF